MINWWIFTASMLIPGVAEFYAAIKLFPFIRERGGLLPFLFCLFSALFDIGFSLALAAIILLGGTLVIELDLSNIVVLVLVIGFVLVFFSWRIASAAISLWFAGVLQEKFLRGLIRVYVRDRRKEDRTEGDVMPDTKPIIKADLPAIVKQLRGCGFTCEAGPLELNDAFLELMRIASDRHVVADVMATAFIDLGSVKTVEYVRAEDVSRPMMDGHVVRLTLEYVPESEIEDH